MIFHAPLQRTCQSAVGIAASFPEAVLQEAEFLTELDYGNDDGKPEDEVVLRLGIAEDTVALSPDISLDDLRAAGKAALKKWDSEAVLPKGWHFLAGRVAELEKQWQEFAEKVLSEYAGKTVVAVTSNGIARFSKVILPIGKAPEGSLKLATGAFGVYEYRDGQWQSTLWNVRPQL
jgi:probable phosphoglycerate mutase